MTHLLDSTALVAFVLDEPEADAVERLIVGGECGVSFATWIELQGRLRSLGLPLPEYEAQFADARALPLATLWADEAVLQRALAVKERGYFPFADSLIAATAWAANLILVHKDPHFTALPREIQQLDLRSLAK
ncbi:MAG TPA: PIN domain-containing protein [Candidatus Acidoferrum sp.]|nr:PIN domain-containing protein [Candidatus Acidoferrum sp.]